MNAATLQHLWDFSIPADLDTDQVWVLSAIKKHGLGMVRLLWRILGCEQMVCDAYQDTFLKLAHHKSGGKPEHVKAYLFRTASNVAISMLRRQAVHKKYVENVSRSENANSTPADDFDHEQICDQLRQYVSKLPDHLREVILLRDFGEMSYRQVANILNITQETARVYRCKAVGLLAIWMKDGQGNE